MRMRCLLHLTLASSIGSIIIGLASSPVAAQSSGSSSQCIRNEKACDITTPCNPASTTSPTTFAPTGTPLTLSSSGNYFQPYLQGATPLLGESFEYLCHVCQPNRDKASWNPYGNAYCTLDTYTSLFETMYTNKNNVIRLQAIFNSSAGAGKEPCCSPFAHEQPYVQTGMTTQTDMTNNKTQWNINNIDITYINNLNLVVGAADQGHMIVEITLLIHGIPTTKTDLSIPITTAAWVLDRTSISPPFR